MVAGQHDGKPSARLVKFKLLSGCEAGGFSVVFRARLLDDPFKLLQEQKVYALKLVTRQMEALLRWPSFMTAGYRAAGREALFLILATGCQHVLEVAGTLMCTTPVDVPSELQDTWQQQAVAIHKRATASLHPSDIPPKYQLDAVDRGSSKRPAREHGAGHCCSATAAGCGEHDVDVAL